MRAAADYRDAMVRVTGPYEIIPGVPPKRHVRVYEPERRSDRERPVVVLFDGQNVFDDAPSFAGGWHAHRAVERLAKSVSPPIIVGLDHGHEHRISELSPFDFGSVRGALPGLLEWMGGWLLPMLRREYALTCDPKRTIIGGSSMGGLAALHSVLARPDLFGGAIVMSPSLWVARGEMMRWAPHNIPDGRPRIYLDAGAKEGGGRMLAAAERMAKLLGDTNRVELKFVADARGQHREADWRRRLLPAMRFHFPGRR